MKTNINNNFFYMEQASDVVELVLPHEVDNPNNVYLYLKEMLGAHTNVQPII